MIELSFPAGECDTPVIGYSGDTLNTAIYLKRGIRERGDVAYVTAIGTDRFSNHMLEFIRKERVDTSIISRDPDRLPGLYAIATEANGERNFSYWRNSSAARQLFQTLNGPDFSGITGYDVIYFSAITLAILPDDIRQALLDWIAASSTEKNLLVAFDSNYRANLWSSPSQACGWIEKAWRLTDIALPSLHDEIALFNDVSAWAVLSRLKSWGVKTGALKNGASGPIPFAPVHGLPSLPPASKVVDTTAAGDSFNGAFLAAILSGQSLADALVSGHQCAARVVGFSGAIG